MKSAFEDFANLIGYDLLRAAIILIVTAIVFMLSRWIIHKLLHKLTTMTKTTLDNRLIGASARPIGFFIIVMGLNYTVKSFSNLMSAGIRDHVDGVFYILVAWAITVWLMRMVSNFFQWYADEIAQRTESTVDDEFIPLIIRLSRIAIAAVSLIIILKHFNQDVQSLVVSLGVGSLALALAAQETLANMIAGFVIMTDRPFRVGDRIELADGKLGDVYQVGLRSTKLLTFDNTLVIVPNSEIVKERLINRSYPDPIIRVRIDVGVAYSSDIDKVKEVLLKIFVDHPEILEEPEPKVHFLEFGDSSLNFMVQGRVDSWKKQFDVAHELRCEISRRFREADIEIPFPQRDIWIRSEPLPQGSDSDSND